MNIYEELFGYEWGPKLIGDRKIIVDYNEERDYVTVLRYERDRNGLRPKSGRWSVHEDVTTNISPINLAISLYKNGNRDKIIMNIVKHYPE